MPANLTYLVIWSNGFGTFEVLSVHSTLEGAQVKVREHKEKCPKQDFQVVFYDQLIEVEV